jgi:hypothetical protein
MITRRLFIPTLLLLAATAAVNAQEPSKAKEPVQIEKDVLIQGVPLPAAPGRRMLFGQDVGGPLAGGTFGLVAAEMSLGGRPVKGAPYAAEAVTESTQVLSDGNRIQHKSSASVFRDSEGRTRREQTLSAIGPWAASGEAPQTIFIDDTEAGIHYILNPKERTARKIVIRSGKGENFTAAFVGAPHQEMRIERHVAEQGEAIAFQASGTWESPLPKPQTEALGKRVIEGVEAEGTRTIMTIPAGQFGNELPIQVVSESWFSAALQAVVMSKHNDPRMGETVYRLAGIDRSEQPRSLFEVPADCKIEEGGPMIQQFRMQKDRPSD